MKYPLRAALAALLAVPSLVAAQQVASIAEQVPLRAGPDLSYPVVTVLPARAQVVVQGCVDGYAWCDVSYGPERGWVYGGALSTPYQGAYAPLPSVAPLLGVGVIGFALGDYWGSHYRGRPWYSQREQWQRPAPPPHYAPRPPHAGPAHPAPPPRDWGRDRDRPRPAPAAPPAPLPPGARGNSGWTIEQHNAPREQP